MKVVIILLKYSFYKYAYFSKRRFSVFFKFQMKRTHNSQFYICLYIYMYSNLFKKILRFFIKKKMKFWIFLVFFAPILCEELHLISRVSSDKQMNELISKHSKASFVYIYSQTDTCENCVNTIQNLTASLEGMIQAYSIFCEKNNPESQNNLEICSQYAKGTTALPQVILIEPTAQEHFKKHMIKIEEINFKFLKALVAKLAPLYSKQLNSFQDLEDYLSDSQHGFNKVLYFYKTPEISMTYKGLTSEYKSRLQVKLIFISLITQWKILNDIFSSPTAKVTTKKYWNIIKYQSILLFYFSNEIK